jgi:hypothetical protein
MKQTRAQWAIIACFFVLTPSLSAQNYWTPIQKEWLSMVVKLLIKAQKKPIENTSESRVCAVSNEITITVARCSDDVKKEDVVFTKPVQ